MTSKVFSGIAALAVAATISFAPTLTNAATIDAPVPEGFIETVGDSEWVWASQCSPDGCGSSAPFFVLDLSFQADEGWRIPTISEVTGFVSALGGLSDLVSVFPGTRCAAQYFTDSTSTNCGTGDISNGAIFNFPGNFVGNTNVDTFLIRDALPPVPVPASLPLLAGAMIAGIGFSRRRAAKKA